MVPASILPAAISIGRRATAAAALDRTSSKGASNASATTPRDGAERGTRIGGPCFGFERRRITAEAHQVEDQLR